MFTIRSTEYKVHVGYTSNGRERNYYFETLRAAQDYVARCFAANGIVLSIVEVKR